ncbi:MAG: MFS transporter [Rhodothermus sp.]|nr:MFS transporter [Rhodothermus sp.]
MIDFFKDFREPPEISKAAIHRESRASRWSRGITAGPRRLSTGGNQPKTRAARLLASPERRYTLVGAHLALFLGALDQTIVATALPRMVADLQGLDRYAWVVTAYLLTFTVATPVYGKLADLQSRKTIVLIAISFFLSGSFLCGLAGEFGSLPILGDGMNQLIVFRAFQGIGGGGLFALAFIIIADLFPPAERGAIRDWWKPFLRWQAYSGFLLAARFPTMVLCWCRALKAGAGSST